MFFKIHQAKLSLKIYSLDMPIIVDYARLQHRYIVLGAEMKLVWILCLFLIGIHTSASAEKINVVKDKNEFGGITAQVTYSPGEPFHDQGIAELIGHMNGKHRIIKLETVYNEAFAKQLLKAKTIEYYDENENKIIQLEEFFTDQYSALFGIARQVTRYDENGKTMQLEKFYTAAWTKKRGITRTLAFYNSSGQMVKKEEFKTAPPPDNDSKVKTITYYDGKGKLLKTEIYDQKGNLKTISP